MHQARDAVNGCVRDRGAARVALGRRGFGLVAPWPATVAPAFRDRRRSIVLAPRASKVSFEWRDLLRSHGALP
jgi:hypothetical protein